MWFDMANFADNNPSLTQTELNKIEDVVRDVNERMDSLECRFPNMDYYERLVISFRDVTETKGVRSRRLISKVLLPIIRDQIYDALVSDFFVIKTGRMSATRLADVYLSISRTLKLMRHAGATNRKVTTFRRRVLSVLDDYATANFVD